MTTHEPALETLEELDFELGETSDDNTYEVVEVTSSAEAERILNRIGRTRLNGEAELARFDRAIEDLQARRDRRAEVLANATAQDERSVETWHRSELGKIDAETGEKIGATFRSAYAESKLTASSPKVEIDDVDAFADWAREHRPELLKPATNDKAIRDAFKDRIKAELPTTEQEANWLIAKFDEEDPRSTFVIVREAPRHKIN